MPFFTKNDNIYPTGDYREVVMGDNVGIREIGGPYIVNPSNYNTYWNYGSVQEAIDTIADALANGGDISTIQDPVQELNPDLFLDARDVDYLTLNGLGAQVIGDQSDTGADFTQVVVANQGQVDSATVPTQISYLAGNAEYSENTLDVAKFAAYSQGSVVSTVGGTDEIYFSLGDADVPNDFLGVSIVGGIARMLTTTGGVQNRFESDNVIPIGSVIEWSCDGVDKFFKVNGLDAPFTQTVGSDTSTWMSTIASPDFMSIAAILDSSPSYSNTTFKHLSIFSTPLTDAESKSFSNSLRAKHEL